MHDDDDALPSPPPSENLICRQIANNIAESILKAAFQELTDEQLEKDEQNLKTQKENQSIFEIKNKNFVDDSNNYLTEKKPYKSIELVRPLSGTTERISSFVYGYGGITKENDDKITDIPVNNNLLIWSSERLKHLAGESPLPKNNANKENYRRSVIKSPQNFNVNQNTLYSLLNKNNQSTVINNMPNNTEQKIVKNPKQETPLIVPIQFSPLTINSNVNTHPQIGIMDTSPQHIFHSYELRRRHHNSVHFSPANSSTFNLARSFFFFLNF